MKKSLAYIYKQQKELSCFGGIAALLGWDQMTYMPGKGNRERAEQLSLISRLAHENLISDVFYNHLNKLYNTSNRLTKKELIIVTQLRKDVEKARKVPAEFVEKMSKTTSLAYTAWEKARKKNKYSMFAPHLEKIIELEKQYCDYIKLPGHPYNSLLDDYEEGMTVNILRKEFAVLRSQLVAIFKKITSSAVYEKQQSVEIKLDVSQQKEICNILLKQLNLPFDRARLDISAHPFTTTIGDDDVRITTNYEHKALLSSFFSTIHEAGHAFYELGILKGEYKDTVISDTPSLGMHESQSRFWENMIARSKSFWIYFIPFFKKVVPQSYKQLRIDSIYQAINMVQPSLIRVEADELTYCLHVILRFELELDLIEGRITAAELPNCWNDKIFDFLDITPKTDREGVLQDMHWSGGEFGYFPTYAIGTIYASQLFKQISKENSMINEEISQGNFTIILNWLSDHIHKYGRLMTAEEIIKKTCGQGLNSKIFIAYLKDKYFPLYEV